MDRELNHSIAHYLDHPIGSARCRSLPGGVLRHVKVAFYFRDADRVINAVLRPFYAIACRFDAHRKVYVHDSESGKWVWCWFCPWERAATRAEEREDRWPNV